MFAVIRDGLCVFGIIFLIKFVTDYREVRDTQNYTTPKTTIETKETIEIAKRTSNKVMSSVAKQLDKLSTVAQNAQFDIADTTSQIEPHQEISAKISEPTETSVNSEPQSPASLLQELEAAVDSMTRYLETDALLSEHDKNQFLYRTKELTSQIEHLQKQVAKDAMTNSKQFHESIDKKMVLLVQKIMLLAIDLVNETTNEVAGTPQALSFQESIETIRQLLTLLIQ